MGDNKENNINRLMTGPSSEKKSIPAFSQKQGIPLEDRHTDMKIGYSEGHSEDQ